MYEWLNEWIDVLVDEWMDGRIELLMGDWMVKSYNR